jgi:hypothetical protein
LLSEEDSRKAISLLTSRYLLQKQDTIDDIPDKLALRWATPKALQEILASEVNTLTFQQFVFLLEHFWLSPGLIQSAFMKLDAPAKTNSLVHFLRAEKVHYEKSGNAGLANKIKTLLSSMSHL